MVYEYTEVLTVLSNPVSEIALLIAIAWMINPLTPNDL
jgi:hypothetical protein